MKTAGIIAEYNPFHRGHEYHIAETRRVTGAEYCVAVMSGDFVQRGEPAILDKYTRAEMALRCGADLVIELPVAYATASAEKFAWGAVSLLDSLGVVDGISCGCEPDSDSVSDPSFGLSFDLFSAVSVVLTEEPELYRAALRDRLKAGLSFPAAREAALLSYFQANPLSRGTVPLSDLRTDPVDQEIQTTSRALSDEDFAIRLHRLISSPNAILALEYEKAIRKLRSPLTLQRICRKGAYHAEELTSSGYASATAVRRFLFQYRHSLSELPADRDALRAVPEPALALLARSPELMEKNDFSAMLGYALLTHRNGDLTAYQDMTPELANRIRNHLTGYQSWEAFSEQIKTKQLTRTHIDRALLHLLLRIPRDSSDPAEYSRPLYARILGFRMSAAPLLKEIKAHSAIPLLSKMADAEKIITSWYQDGSQAGQPLPGAMPQPATARGTISQFAVPPFTMARLAISQLEQDLFAAEVYETARAKKYSVPKRNEYRQEIIRLSVNDSPTSPL